MISLNSPPGKKEKKKSQRQVTDQIDQPDKVTIEYK